MTKITQVAEGAYFVPSYSEQTIIRAYSTETTLQSYAYGNDDVQERKRDASGHEVTPTRNQRKSTPKLLLSLCQ